jgi:hypothetical protein
MLPIMLLAASNARPAPAQPKEVASLASAVLAELSAGAVRRACARIYEPSDWDEKRIADDRTQLSKGIAALMNETGTISATRLVHGAGFFEVQITGADVPYWEALPNRGIAARVTYTAKFAKAGPGIVSFTFTHLSGRWELRSISFGVEPSAPNARETVTRLASVFLKAMIPGITKEQLDQIAAQMVTVVPV